MPNFRGAKAVTYGSAHRKARALAFKNLPEHSPCVRCGKPMWKWSKDKQGKSALHYDHNDNRTGYLGFSCRDCNVRAGASKGARIANARRAVVSAKPWRSRAW